MRLDTGDAAFVEGSILRAKGPEPSADPAKGDSGRKSAIAAIAFEWGIAFIALANVAAYALFQLVNSLWLGRVGGKQRSMDVFRTEAVGPPNKHWISVFFSFAVAPGPDTDRRTWSTRNIVTTASHGRGPETA